MQFRLERHILHMYTAGTSGGGGQEESDEEGRVSYMWRKK